MLLKFTLNLDITICDIKLLFHSIKQRLKSY